MVWPICWGMPAQEFTSVIPFTPSIASLSPFLSRPPSVSLLLSHPFLTWTHAHECFLIWLQASALGDWHKKLWTEWSRNFQSYAILPTNRLMSRFYIFAFVEPSLLECQFVCLSLLWWIHLSLRSSQPLSGLRHTLSCDSLIQLHTLMASSYYYSTKKYAAHSFSESNFCCHLFLSPLFLSATAR